MLHKNNLYLSLGKSDDCHQQKYIHTHTHPFTAKSKYDDKATNKQRPLTNNVARAAAS